MARPLDVGPKRILLARDEHPLVARRVPGRVQAVEQRQRRLADEAEQAWAAGTGHRWAAVAGVGGQFEALGAAQVQLGRARDLEAVGRAEVVLERETLRRLARVGERALDATGAAMAADRKRLGRRPRHRARPPADR